MRELFRCYGQIIMILMSVALFTLSCQEEAETSKDSIIDADQKVLNQLVIRYGVPRNFYHLFPEQQDANKMWEPTSVRVSEVIAEMGDQPLLFIVRLDDIVSSDSGYTAIFSSGFGFLQSALGSFTGQLELSCTSTQKSNLIRGRTGNSLEGFAVVATINRFRRPRFHIEVSDGNSGYQNQEISVGTPGPIILIGSLVEASSLQIGMPVHNLKD